MHGGAPFIQLAIGAATEDVPYVAGESSGGILTFRYDIASNDLDGDGIQWNDGEIKFTGGAGSIKDQAGNHAPTTGLTIPSLLGVLVDHSTSLTFNTPGYLNGENENSYSFSGTCVGLDGESLNYTISQQGLADSITGTATCTQGAWGVQSLNLATSALSEGEFNIEISSSITTSNATAVKDTIAPELTGLSDDDTPTKSKTWNWGCDHGQSECKYRFAVNNNNSHEFTNSDGYSTVEEASQTSGNETYYLHVQAKDRAGNKSGVRTVSAIIDNRAPTVSGSIGVPANGFYTQGQILNFTATFSENIVVQGTSFLRLTLGSKERNAEYTPTPDGDANIMTFSYEVRTGDLALDGIEMTDTVYLNDGSIRDAAGNDAIVTDLSIPSLTGLWVFSSFAAELTRASAVMGFYKEGSDIIITADFAVKAIVEGTPELSLRVGTNEMVKARFSGTVGTANQNQQFTYTVANGENDIDGIEIIGIILDGTDSIKDTYNYDMEPFNDVVHLASVRVDTSAPTPAPSLSISPTSPSDDTRPQLTIGNLIVGEKNRIRVYENANCTDPTFTTRIVRTTSETVDAFPLHSNGNHYFSVNVIDLAENESSCTSVSYTLSRSEITVGQYYTCVLSKSGVVKCWGYGGLGQLGRGDTQDIGDQADEMGSHLVAVNLGTVDGMASGSSLTATAIDANFYHVCALLNNAHVKCWGNGADGQLGQNHTNTIGDETDEMGNNLNAIDLGTVDGTALTAKAIRVGHYHSCALLNNGHIKCWGSGYRGVLGQGHTNAIGDETGEMGNNLNVIDLGTVDGTNSGAALTTKAISTGNRHACTLLSNDTIKCWGGGAYGQLGQGNINTIGDEAGEMGNNLDVIDLGTVDGMINGVTLTVKDVQAGNYHTCALLSNDTVKCWGKGVDGQLGQGNTSTVGDEMGEMGNNLNAIDLGTVNGTESGAVLTAKAIRVGHDHTCAILSNDTVKCWGKGADGQLGQGDTNAIGDEVDEMGNNLNAIDLGTVDGTNSGTALTVRDIDLGHDHTCALLSNNGIKCWGAGYHGQLGQGNTDSLGVDEGQMGNNLVTIDLD